MTDLNSSTIPVEIEGGERSIFILDGEIELLKKLGKEVVENYPSYQVVACDNTVDFSDELISKRVSVFIVEIRKENSEEILDLIRSLRQNPMYQKTSIMVMATREVLELHSSFLQTMEAQLVPKAIRLPFFMGVLQSCLSRENSVEINVIELSAGEVLFKEGDIPEHIFITKSGELEVYQMKDGDEFVLGAIGTKEVVGEMAFLKKEKRSASVRARTNCTVLSIELANIGHFVEAQPFWLKMILDSLIKRIESMNTKLKNASS